MQLLFYCNALADNVRAERRIAGDSPAATRKVVGLCRACRAAGIDARIVSLGRGRVQGLGWFGSRRAEIDGVPIAYGPMLHVPVLSHLVSMIWLACLALRASNRRIDQVHLFYNQLTYYLPAMAMLRALGRRTFVDIEDGPIAEPAQPGAFKAKWGANAPPALFARFISGGALLANTALARGTTIKPSLPYYGALPAGTEKAASAKPELHLLFSGTLEPETGASLLAASLPLIDARPEAAQITITITGQGSALDALRAAAARLHHLRVQVLGRIDLATYQDVLRGADAGLSLKPIGASISDTTFPSKTIEYAEHGLLLISTDISDVRSIFGGDAWYLEQNDPQQLAQLILQAARDPAGARATGRRGQALVSEQFSYARAGERLRQFFFPGRG